MDVDKILSERGDRYGDFADVAATAKEIQESVLLRCGPLEPFMVIAIQNIAMKLSRVANGNPEYIDNWVDIAGYAQLVANELKAESLKKGSEQ